MEFTDKDIELLIEELRREYGKWSKEDLVETIIEPLDNEELLWDLMVLFGFDALDIEGSMEEFMEALREGRLDDYR